MIVWQVWLTLSDVTSPWFVAFSRACDANSGVRGEGSSKLYRADAEKSEPRLIPESFSQY